MTRRQKWVVQGLVGLFATVVAGLGVGGVWLELHTRPLPSTVEVERGETYIRTFRHTHSRELLPLSSWGFGGYSMIACGRGGTTREQARKYGFFIVIDRFDDSSVPITAAGR